MTGAPRGFEENEFQDRLNRAQALMASHDLDGLLVTTHPDIYYFTGFLTRFWESPTRPWFVVVPRSGKPVAVIPSIGATLMGSTWVEDIRTWVSPNLTDDGVSLLSDTLVELAKGGRIGIPDGHESHLRMPISDFDRLKRAPNLPSLVSDQGIVRALRMVKSAAELQKIGTACSIADRAFHRVSEFAGAGVSMETIFRQFQMRCLEEGADWVPYLAGGAGQAGYADVISPADETLLAAGDVLMLDTGLVYDGYFCDFDRNFGLGPVSQTVADCHARLIEATHAGFESARPGATASDVFMAMNRVLSDGEEANENGRLGHGLGIQLTEWPSIIPTDDTVLEAGMVLTLEPSIETVDGHMLVHEENIVLTGNGARYLTEPQGISMRVIEP